MLDMMQKEPAMQAQMYPFLPEEMRNTESITRMLSDEACCSQLEAVLIAQVPINLIQERCCFFSEVRRERELSSLLDLSNHEDLWTGVLN